ncbi:hypothetical protein [Wolbachia endosymbiont (group A) of Brachyopa scutellaris]|uniref:hypothetical protein n=1 Tax=Wolbachia endosymbiont (group A) of Brachyopa scutellaris TaxID=3066140 RepID=UPI003132C5B9
MLLETAICLDWLWESCYNKNIYSGGITVMPYSNDDIEDLASHIAKMLRYTGDIDLKDLLKGSKWKEVNFQDECEGGNLLGDLLLKHATENNNSRVKDFLLKNGCKPLQQEQITAAINKEEEAPNVEENRADSNEVDSSNSINPGMTAEVLYGQLIQGKKQIRQFLIRLQML